MVARPVVQQLVYQLQLLDRGLLLAAKALETALDEIVEKSGGGGEEEEAAASKLSVGDILRSLEDR